MAMSAVVLAILVGSTSGLGAATPRVGMARARPLTTACRAGFGKAGPAAASAPPKKLTAKKQWDRFADLVKKGAQVAEVAVRKDEEGAWRPVGRVCATADATPLGAVTRQRALVEEHGRRLHLALVAQTGKAPLQVGFRPAEGAEFELLAKKAPDAAPISDVEIGFEGLPDPATGYYCSYKDGKLVANPAD
ncbi:hypothetical protein KFE25_005656 [Diacronema lutheri]|uniref:Photosystem II reaction center Psb28 protein n=2 Tax=Diacronema lutheri TaxID=2081491 RepID=A0A8J6CCG8_DIALT|nr:hypothetical protein KFE25_005656 [Diacronema lutheri]